MGHSGSEERLGKGHPGRLDDQRDFGFPNGLPFSTFDSSSGRAFGATGIGTGLLMCRPQAQQVADAQGRIQDRLAHYFNPNWLSQAQDVPNGSSGATGYGNVPRNSFRGPFQQNWDFSVGRRFGIREGMNLAFRADFFNIFNHPIFQQPAVVQVATPATAGQITATTIPARLIQFGLRFAF